MKAHLLLIWYVVFYRPKTIERPTRCPDYINADFYREVQQEYTNRIAISLGIGILSFILVWLMGGVKKKEIKPSHSKGG